MNKPQRGHPIQILVNIRKLLILLFIPILRGLLAALTGGLVSWLEGAWLDITIACVILGAAVIQWRQTTYKIDDTGVCLEKGVLIKRQCFIPKEKILSSITIRSFYLRPLKAVNFRLDTLGGSYKQSDFRLILNRKKAAAISDILIDKSPARINIYRSNFFYVMALSLITSNSFAGIVIITTFISNLGQALGHELSTRIYDTFQRVSNSLAFGIPPAAAGLAFLLFIGWFVTFVINVIRYRNLTVIRQGDSINIKCGIFTIREYEIKPRAISYIDIRQTLLTKLLGLYSIFVYAIGFGKDKDDVSAFVPAVKKKHISSAIKKLTPKFKISDRTLKPNLGAMLRFITDPLYFCLGIPAITFLLIRVYPDWKDFLVYIATIPMIPALWFFTVRLIDCFTSGISKHGGCYTIRYSKGFYFHTVVVPEDKISEIKTRQSPIQKFDKKCDVFIYTCSEGIKIHRCRNLNKEDVLKLF